MLFQPPDDFKPINLILFFWTIPMYVIEFSALAETNRLVKERKKRAKYMYLLGELQSL